MNDIFCASEPEITESEKNVVSNIVEQINNDSLVQFDIDNVFPYSNTYNHDSYKILSTEGESFLLKISFGNPKPLICEYNVLRSISSLNCAPSAINKFAVSCFASEGLALLTSFVEGHSFLEIGVNNVFSEEEEIRRLFRNLAKISSIDTKNIEFIKTEPSIAQDVGKLSSLFGEDFLNKFKEVIDFDDFQTELEKLRTFLMIKSSQFNFGKLINASLRPDNLIFPTSRERKHRNYYILDWSNSFIGNPLYDFMNLILENRLFEKSDYYKSLYFEEFFKHDSSLAVDMEYIYVEYFNYFIALKFWLSIVRYIELCIENEFTPITKIEHVRFIETLDYFKANIYKVLPSSSKLIDKFMKMVYN